MRQHANASLKYENTETVYLIIYTYISACFRIQIIKLETQILTKLQPCFVAGRLHWQSQQLTELVQRASLLSTLFTGLLPLDYHADSWLLRLSLKVTLKLFITKNLFL